MRWRWRFKERNDGLNPRSRFRRTGISLRRIPPRSIPTCDGPADGPAKGKVCAVPERKEQSPFLGMFNPTNFLRLTPAFQGYSGAPFFGTEVPFPIWAILASGMMRLQFLTPAS